MLLASPQKIYGQLNDNPTITYFFNSLYSPTFKILSTPAVQQQPPHYPQQSERLKPPSTTNLNLIKPTHHLFIKHKNPIKGPILTPTTKAKPHSGNSTEHPKKKSFINWCTPTKTLPLLEYLKLVSIFKVEE